MSSVEEKDITLPVDFDGRYKKYSVVCLTKSKAEVIAKS